MLDRSNTCPRTGSLPTLSQRWWKYRAPFRVLTNPKVGEPTREEPLDAIPSPNDALSFVNQGYARKKTQRRHFLDMQLIGFHPGKITHRSHPGEHTRMPRWIEFDAQKLE